MAVNHDEQEKGAIHASSSLESLVSGTPAADSGCVCEASLDGRLSAALKKVRERTAMENLRLEARSTLVEAAMPITAYLCESVS